jgi:hypothetical protein
MRWRLVIALGLGSAAGAAAAQTLNLKGVDRQGRREPMTP